MLKPAAMARPWVLAAAALWLAALAHSPRTTAFAAGAVNRRGSVGGTALLENAKSCIFMFQARQSSLRRTEPLPHAPLFAQRFLCADAARRRPSPRRVR